MLRNEPVEIFPDRKKKKTNLNFADWCECWQVPRFIQGLEGSIGVPLGEALLISGSVSGGTLSAIQTKINNKQLVDKRKDKGSQK